jgi:hypothetical protein
MKIDYVILGSNTNPYYLDFWPIVSKIWKEKFNKIGYISPKEDILIEIKKFINETCIK